MPIDLGGPVEQVRVAVCEIYDVGPLDPAAVSRLRETFLAEPAAIACPDGRARPTGCGTVLMRRYLSLPHA